MRYWIVIERGKNNCSAFCPDVPGCVTTGKSIEDTIKNMREALSCHFEGLAEDGDKIPLPGRLSRAKASRQIGECDVLAAVDVPVKTLASA
ncbi:MAG: type II toxin-antitoxin system HicB family antitoxin [Opitutales bacterium]|nr:type II toxin-antitoxin system HicB family antitoxin [Opitutales bacterium]